MNFNHIPCEEYQKQITTVEDSKIENEEAETLLKLVRDKCFTELNQAIEIFIKDEDQLKFIKKELEPYKLLIELVLRKIADVNVALDSLVDDMYNVKSETTEVKEFDI